MDGSCAKDDGGVGGDDVSSADEGGVCTVAPERLDGLSGDGRPSPMPRETIASSRAWIRCFRTSLAAFLTEKRICRIASSIGFPAICLASGASFFMDVLKKCDRDKCVRSVRASRISLVRRPRRRISRITIRRCQRERAVGRGFNTGAMLFGLRDSRESAFFCASRPASGLSSFFPPSTCCGSSLANRLLSAKSPILIAAAMAASCCSLSLAFTLAAAAAPESGRVAVGEVTGLGSGPVRCGRLLGVAN